MPVSSNDFLTLVQKSQASANTEMDYRNIVSRSYYGMYHGVLELLTNEPIPIKGMGCHESLKEYLSSYDAKKNEPYEQKDLRRLKTFLEIYKTKRRIADYDLEEDIQADEANASVIALNGFLDNCQKMKSEIETKTKTNP